MSPASSPRDLVVIGASAGGVQALKQVVRGLPADLPAAVCVVLHLAPDSPSALPAILDRAGALPCSAAHDGDELVHSHILVAPPNYHLAVQDGRVRLTVGPPENNLRPAVNVLFRSAAAERGADVIGVVLSGTRDDGTAGLAVIKSHGGATIVQDPADALYPGMPANAIANVSVDAVVPAQMLARTITEMVSGGGAPRPPMADPSDPQHKPEDSGVTICPEALPLTRMSDPIGPSRFEEGAA